VMEYVAKRKMALVDCGFDTVVKPALEQRRCINASAVDIPLHAVMWLMNVQPNRAPCVLY